MASTAISQQPEVVLLSDPSQVHLLYAMMALAGRPEDQLKLCRLSVATSREAQYLNTQKCFGSALGRLVNIDRNRARASRAGSSMCNHSCLD